jgi:hypothetical protein
MKDTTDTNPTSSGSGTTTSSCIDWNEKENSTMHQPQQLNDIQQVFCSDWKERLQQCGVVEYQRRRQIAHDEEQEEFEFENDRDDEFHQNHPNTNNSNTSKNTNNIIDVITSQTPIVVTSIAKTESSDTKIQQHWKNKKSYTSMTQYYFQLYQLENELQQQQQLLLQQQQQEQPILDSFYTSTINEELKQCQTMIHNIRIRSCNEDNNTNHEKNKKNGHIVPFLFYKYRQFIYNQQKNSSNSNNNPHSHSSRNANTTIVDNNNDNNSSSTIIVQQRLQRQQISSASSSTIENLTHAWIVVHETGTVHIHHQNHQQQQQQSSNDHLTISETTSTMMILGQMIVLQNLMHCTIQLHGQYKGLHIVNVQHTNIEIHYNNSNDHNTPISGAIHITDCQYSTIKVSNLNSETNADKNMNPSLPISISPSIAQQLRIHNSHYIQCYNVQTMIDGSIILEDCDNITFHVVVFMSFVSDWTTTSPTTTTTTTSTIVERLQQRIIKDFNWLRNGIPSPNYTIKCDTVPVNVDNTTCSSISYMYPSSCFTEEQQSYDSNDEEI